MKKPTAEEIRNEFERRKKCLINALRSPDGRAGLEYLTVMFGGDVLDATKAVSDPNGLLTHVRIGERRVVDHLIGLQEERDVS